MGSPLPQLLSRSPDPRPGREGESRQESRFPGVTAGQSAAESEEELFIGPPEGFS